VQTVPLASYPSSLLVPNSLNRCLNNPSMRFGDLPTLDSVFNCLTFPIDLATHPECSTQVVDACQPRWIKGFATNQEYELDKLFGTPLGGLPADLQATMMDNCAMATAFARTLRQFSGSAANDPFVESAARLWYDEHKSALVVVRPLDFFHTGTPNPIPELGTRPVSTAPPCSPDKPNDARFPVFVQDISVSKGAQFVGAIASLNRSRSNVTVTVGSGANQRIGATTVGGEILGDKVDCHPFAPGSDVIVCLFRITALRLSLDTFTIDGRTVTDAAIAGNGIGCGSPRTTVLMAPGIDASAACAMA
jgi:hypothetical protein